jgi:hypothetical protein
VHETLVDFKAGRTDKFFTKRKKKRERRLVCLLLREYLTKNDYIVVSTCVCRIFSFFSSPPCVDFFIFNI